MKINPKSPRFIAIVAILVVSVSVVWWCFCTGQVYITPEIQECIAQKQSQAGSSYTKGVIIVAFKDNVTETDARNLLGRYGLLIENYNSIGIERVYTPQGTEFNWLCILEESELVRYTGLSGSTKALDGEFR